MLWEKIRSVECDPIACMLRTSPSASRCRHGASDEKCARPRCSQSGLTQACRESSVSVEEAEQRVLSLVSQLVPPGKCHLAGNTVYMDRLFLARYMPELNSYLHYRIVDVSTIKELCRFVPLRLRLLRGRGLSGAPWWHQR